MADAISNGRDRRAYFRLAKILPVRFRICDRNPDRVYSAASRNISHGGMCLEVAQNQTELLNALQHRPQRAMVELQTPVFDHSEFGSAQTNWISGEIDWHQRPTADNLAVVIGLSFVRVTDRTRKQLHDLMVREFVSQYGVKDWQTESVPVFAFDVK